MASLNAVMEELSRRASIAMHHQHYDDALYNIDKALEIIPGVMPHLTIPLLLRRADCFWHLNKYDRCHNDMHTVCKIGLPALSLFETKVEYDKWMARGESLLNNGVSMAPAFFDLCKIYCKTPKEQARCFVLEGVATCSFFDQRRGMELIRQGEQVDRSILEEISNEWRTNGIFEFKNRNYPRSKCLLQRALMVTRDDGAHSETRRSILSHLATVHFNLKEYQLALNAGENSFRAKNVPSKDEAERWKERGRTLFKEKNFPLLIKYYSLAIKFTSPEDLNFRELRSVLLSNRSIAYNKTRMYQEALADAKECVRINPRWSKGQYRLGSSLLSLGRDQEALASFTSAFKVADSSETKDIALQILTVGEKLKDGISRESLSMPKELVQELVNRVTDQREWKKLHVLFMGGAGSPYHRYGEGGVATGLGCDVSCVPLEVVVDWGISNNVDFLAGLVEELIKCGAPVQGSSGCVESPLKIAKRRKDVTLVEVLSKYDKTQGRFWKDKGLDAFRSKNYGQAIRSLSSAINCGLSTEDQVETYYALSEAYYATKDYRNAIDYANKLYKINSLKSKDVSEKWKKRGNDLLGEKRYGIMTGCYTLALNYSPNEDPDMLAAILSNRSMAYLNQKLIAEAKNDANLCILNRRTWFRGYSRLAACFAAENDHDGAVNQYCRGLSSVQTDEEKFNLANDLILLAKKRVTGNKTMIPQPIPSNIVNKLIKQAVQQKDYETLRYLFVERVCPHGIGSTLHMRTLAHDVQKVSFVPLETILQSDVQDKEQLVMELLARGANPNGGPNCTRTPLQLAIDKKDYRMAACLLQHGANPSQILEPNEWFNPSEGSQGVEWLRLARKAKQANPKRAEVFYSLALEYQEVARNQPVQLEAFKSLSEIHFNSKKYDECLRYGYKCLKLVPNKSEAEARKWQERGEMLITRGIFSEVPNYLTLALNYAPPINKPLRYKLLCRRSFAHHEIEDFQQAVEDGVNATKIQPDDIKGYKCLVSCYRSLGRHSRMLHALNQCLKTEPNQYERLQYFQEAMNVAVALPEGTTGLTSEVPTSFIEQIQDKAIQSHDWEMLRLLYVGGGGPHQHQAGKGGLATNRVRATGVAIEDAVSAKFTTNKPETMEALLDHGAYVNGLRGNSNPLVCAVLKEEVEVVKVLLEHGANPCVKTNNQPLLHKVVQKAIDTGNFELLRCLLSFHNAEMENLQDPKGNTLYHLAMTGKVNEKKKTVIKLLIDANINPHLKNNSGKVPGGSSNRDDRKKMLSKFKERFVPTVREEAEEKKQVGDKANDKSNGEQVAAVSEQVDDEKQDKVPIPAGSQPQITPLGNRVTEGRKIEKKPSKTKAQNAQEAMSKEIARKQIEYLIERLKIIRDDDLSHQATEEVEETVEGNEDSQEAMEIPENEEGTESVREDDDEEENGTETAKNDEEEIDVLDSDSPFENLTWEVDCTENVWKTLQSKRVEGKMKSRIVRKIRMLAEGRWSKTTCKKLKGEPEKKGILLYESKLTKGGRILWEKTIAFSARCSNDPTLRLREPGSEDGADGGGDSKGASGGDTGKIYSDIIRVWSIVLDHGDLAHQIENVVKSHDRGSHCIVKADLKGCGNKKTGSGENYPSYYMERSKKDTSAGAEETFFPPASSKENEFHILKFYSVTSAVINTLLDGDGKTKIDFPFKVTELEHAIINLQPKPPCPIILLGRSGTGKTTCCLYRLWTEFQNYWKTAATAGPFIPKYIPEPEISDEEESEAAGDNAESSSEVKSIQTPLAEHDVGGVCAGVSHEAKIPDDDINGASNTPERCEHFHPLFITKNTVLCSEVKKNFKELRNACPDTKANTNDPDDSIPNRIDDIGDTSWPLFIGARDWLLLLDASLPGTSYFKRAKDGSLLKKIEGWGEDDTHLHFIPEEEEEEEEDDDDEGERAVAEEGDAKQSKPQAKDVKREATYQVFRDELWTKMNKSLKTKYHPTLVWTEIRSFIKGSVEALETDQGFLSQQQYEELGRKRAPNFMGDRGTVYELFLNYRRICRSQGIFDEADLVYHLHKRLSENPELPWSIHSVYVDETQDFTQAELSLLIRCCRFQNRMFFTGDTAQSIMRGIAFRFEDLKTLFHGINTFNVTTPDEPVRIPDRLYQLTHNYRSHAGILRLASSVVNLLSYYFPESFDKLEEDRGLFDGPKPVLLESCSLSDLAMILRGNKRQTSRIEFGAHQAVLVVSEEARDNMPEELKHGLVLTIYEAKGLEFDDVLIYNFFKDSQAKKEWRVVTSYIEEMQKETHYGTSGLVELQEKDLKSKTRPLEFQPEKHKVLNSEFKYLYTAITRARVNVWFFDQDEESRSPMFEYFRRLNLVRAIVLEDEEEGTASLSSMFAESSTKEEWREQGRFFYDKDLWAVAEKCFVFGEDELMVRKCKAQQQAQEALKHRRVNPRLMKEKFILAATQFLECDMAKEAAVCLYNARERLLLAKLYRKMERFEEAAKYFRLEAHFEEASECMENINNYSQAIEIFCEAKLYEKAIEVLERYNSLKMDEMEGFVPPKPNRTIERLCYKLAETHLKDGKREDMERVLQRLPSADDRISFLKKHECIEEAARALVDNNRREEAAQFLQLHGKFKAAKRYASDDKFLGDCSLYEARVLSQNQNPEQHRAEVVQLLEDAIKYYRRCKDHNREAEASLFLGRLKDDADMINESGKLFHQCKNICGESEVVDEWLKRGNLSQFYYRIAVRTIEGLLDLIYNLHKPYTKLRAKQQEQITSCEQFFGLVKVDDTHIRGCRTSFGERFHHVAPGEILKENKNMQVEVNVKDAYQAIARDLIAKATVLTQKATEFFKSKLELKERGETYILADMPLHEKFEILFNWVHLESVTAKFYNQLKQLGNPPILSEAESVIPKEKERFLSCRLFTEFLFPEAGCKVQHPTVDQITKIRIHHAVKPRLMQFCDSQWKTLETEARRETTLTDVFLLVSRVMQLLDMRDQGINVYLNEKEKAFFQAIKKDPNNRKLVSESGMLPLKGRSGQISFEIFLRHWEIGKKELHVNCDVVQSLHETSRRFLTYTAKSHSRFYPTIANTLMILEHQFTVSLLLFARLKCQSRRFCCCIPESYLKRLETTDALNCTRRGVFTIISAVEKHAQSRSSLPEEQKCLRALQNLLSHIVELMFGIVSYDFNVFYDTFFTESSDQLIASGVADRTLILSLTMLVNCGMVLYAKCEEVMLHHIFTVIPHSLPEHLKTAFQSMREVRNLSDAVKVLKDLLHARTAEKLFDVRWNYGSLGLDKRISNPDNYNFLFEVNVPEIKEKAKAESSRPVVSSLSMKEQEEENPEDDNTAEADAKRIREMEEERRYREAHLQAVINMQRIVRRRRTRRELMRLKRAAEGKDYLDPTEDHLSAFKTDSTACTICGVDFQDSSDKNVEGSEDTVSSSHASHVASPSHIQMQQQFDEYRNLYESRIAPVLSQVRSLNERNVNEIALDIHQLDERKRKLWDKVTQIERQLEWKDTLQLIPLLESVEEKLRQTESLVQDSSTADFNEKDEQGIAEGHNEEDEDEALEEIPTTKKQRSGGPRNKGRQGRKKRR